MHRIIFDVDFMLLHSLPFLSCSRAFTGSDSSLTEGDDKSVDIRKIDQRICNSHIILNARCFSIKHSLLILLDLFV